MDERANADDNDTVPFSVCHGVVECFCSDEFIVLKWPLRACDRKKAKLETVSIAEPLQNRQHAQNPNAVNSRERKEMRELRRVR